MISEFNKTHTNITRERERERERENLEQVGSILQQVSGVLSYYKLVDKMG